MDWQKFKRVEISPTTHCNANCPLCARTNISTGKKWDYIPLIHLPKEKLFGLVDRHLNVLGDIQTLELCGDWGDPMMHPDIEDMVDYIIGKKKIYVAIDTNGGTRNPEFYARLAQKHGEKIWINFSIDGANKQTNLEYRKDVDFDLAISNLKSFAKHNPWNCSWQMLLFMYNYHQIDDVATFCEDHSICFEFKANKRIWKYRTIEDPQTLAYIEEKKKDYRHLLP